MSIWKQKINTKFIEYSDAFLYNKQKTINPNFFVESSFETNEFKLHYIFFFNLGFQNHENRNTKKFIFLYFPIKKIFEKKKKVS